MLRGRERVLLWGVGWGRAGCGGRVVRVYVRAQAGVQAGGQAGHAIALLD